MPEVATRVPRVAGDTLFAILGRYVSGEPLRDTASACGVCPATVLRLAKRHGVFRGKPGGVPGRHDERNAAIVRLWRRGEPIGAIARRYSLCRERIEQIVRQAKREAVHG